MLPFFVPSGRTNGNLLLLLSHIFTIHAVIRGNKLRKTSALRCLSPSPPLSVLSRQAQVSPVCPVGPAVKNSGDPLAAKRGDSYWRGRDGGCYLGAIDLVEILFPAVPNDVAGKTFD